MNHYANRYVEITIVTAIYMVALIIVSPIIDDIFTRIDKDIEYERGRVLVLFEVTTHIVVLNIVWFTIHSYLKHMTRMILHINIDDEIERIVSMASSVVLVGLQRNLVYNLKYITNRGPIQD